MKRQPMPAVQPIAPLRPGNGGHLHDGGPEIDEPSTPRSMARPGRTKAHVLLGGSALIAAATALTVLLLLSQLKERAESEAARRVTVVMAARDLPVGTPIEADDLRVAL
ncbi:MAG: hypothetical protein QGG40_04175, partial [Myxococcota bacterium]|nr:hypothetical protein [Myxococcota bacterium]